jgi:hypothetical protein
VCLEIYPTERALKHHKTIHNIKVYKNVPGSAEPVFSHEKPGSPLNACEDAADYIWDPFSTHQEPGSTREGLIHSGEGVKMHACN